MIIQIEVRLSILSDSHFIGWKDVKDGDTDAWIQLDMIDGNSDDRFLWKISVS